jgi:hypothetical protein
LDAGLEADLGPYPQILSDSWRFNPQELKRFACEESGEWLPLAVQRQRIDDSHYFRSP